MWIVTVIYWLQAFLAPVLLLGLAGFFTGDRTVFILLLAVGALTGLIFAEYIRRKYGLDVFFARIYGPNQMDDPLNSKKYKRKTDAGN